MGNQRPQSGAELRMNGAIDSTSPYAFITRTGLTLIAYYNRQMHDLSVTKHDKYGNTFSTHCQLMSLYILCNIMVVLKIPGTADPLKVSLILWTPSLKLPQLTATETGLTANLNLN